MAGSSGSLRTTIRLTVVVVFLLATCLTAAIAIGLQYYFGQAAARQASAELYTAASSSIATELAGIGRLNYNIMQLLAENPLLKDAGEQRAQLEIFSRVLEQNPLYYGVYLGRSDGSLFELINLDNNKYARQALRAIASDRWVVMQVLQQGASRQRSFQYLDKDLQPRTTRYETTAYEVTGRPWYSGGLNATGIASTERYRFAQLGVKGRTLSLRVGNTETVIAIDMTLSSISEYLRNHALSRQSEIYLFNDSGEVIASSVESSEDPSMLADPVLEAEDTWSSEEGKSVRATSPTVPDKAFTRIAGTSNQHGQLIDTVREGVDWLVYVAPTGGVDNNPMYVGIRTPESTVVAPFMDEVKLSIGITAGFLLLILPLSWLFANPIVHPIRQLAAENDKVKRREYDKVQRVASNVKELDELSESMVAMVDSIRAHELAQRRLMDSFIELIAQAIDDKSAYTGGHCARVPELAVMLASHASDSQLAAFKHFRLSTEDQWREYRIAAWLHDCGKITTPEHIVDKGSKLETIYNRIHEIRMRFEVLWRDAEIEFWRGQDGNPELFAQLKDLMREKQKQLQEDFKFIADCNVGGEFMGEEEQQHLHNIAQKTWLRYFDDRLGLSPIEELRLPSSTRPDLPVTEQLLSDKPEHIVERVSSTEYPPEFGIDMEVPDHLSNLGEIYNLSISRGTLTAEDRFRINEHMISTIKMLESLPFPEELKNVPRYASTHHETMKGSGYPRKIPGEQLSIPERILAVADIFEALTASDRPYKKAKPVSVALDIMHAMVRDNHIDGDCFELFVREGVYLEYAKAFLDPGQIDEVELGRYVS